MRNSLADLNNYLFEALENVQSAEDDEELKDAIKRAKIVRDVGAVIVSNANVMLKGMRAQSDRKTMAKAEKLITGGE